MHNIGRCGFKQPWKTIKECTLRLRLKSEETNFRVIASYQSLTDMTKMTGSP